MVATIGVARCAVEGVKTEMARVLGYLGLSMVRFRVRRFRISFRVLGKLKAYWV